MTITRAMLKAVGLVSALFGGAAAATRPGDDAPVRDPAARFGPDRLLADATARARFAADPGAAVGRLGVDPNLFDLPSAMPADAVAGLGTGWDAPPSSIEAAAEALSVAQVAVYGPPPTPGPTPSIDVQPPLPHHSGKAVHRARRRIGGSSPTPTPTASDTPSAPPAPVYGPPPGR